MMIDLRFFLIFCLYYSEVTSNVCYGCRDSSSLKGKDDCQVNTNKMEKLHTTLMNDYGNKAELFLEDYKNDPYVQDCSVLTNHSMCCIEEFEGGGSIKSYIRQCCDGNTWSFNPKKVPLLKLVTTNNDTICQHDTTSLTTVCIRMCTGNFCNGPVSRADKLHASLVTIISVVLYIAMFLQ